MGRGLVLGSTLISFFTFLLCLISAFVPLWLVLRTEHEQEFCWWGEGIFHSRFYYGNDLDKVFIQCKDPEGYGLISTNQAYCSGDDSVPILNENDPPNYADVMCTKTKQAKVTSIIAIISSFITMCIGCALHFLPMSKFEYFLTIFAVICSICTMLMSFATLIIMITSPLFSMDHNRALSATHVGIPFDGFSCSLTTPLRSILTMVLSAPLLCLFPGPSFLSPILVIFVQPIACIFFYKLSKEVLASHFPLSVALLSSSPLPLEQRGRLDFNELRKFRVYSLYGAFARKLKNLSSWKRTSLIVVIPFILIIGHALVWTGFLLSGIQIIGGFGIKVRYPTSSSLLENQPNKTTTVVFSPQVLEEYQNDIETLALKSPIFALMKKLVENKKHEIALWKGEGTLILYEDIVNAFNFSPELSVGYFWNNGAGFIAVLTFLAMFVLPLGKSMVWIWYYFAPGDEWWRGWILTFTDFSGKWTLAYMVIIAIMSVSMALDRTYSFPWFLFPGILPKGSELETSVIVGITWGGVGGILLVICCTTSLAFGQMILLLHQKAVEWEEDYREKKDSMTNLAQDINMTPHLLTVDTPSLHRGQPINRNPQETNRGLLQAIQSFSNFQDISPDPIARQPMLNAIARYGSRTVLSDNNNERPSRRGKSLHPIVEAMCDRVHQPMQGVKLRWTPFGKAIIWFFFFFLAVSFILAQMVELFRARQTGVGMFIVKPADVARTYSIFTMYVDVINTGYDSKPYHIAIFFFLTLSLMPMVRLLASAYLWVLPLTVKQQKRCFDFLEFSDAWGSLEVFLVTTFAIWIEMGNIMQNLTGAMTPKIAELLQILLPFLKGLVGAELELLPGFWFVCFAILFEKFVSKLIMQQAVTAIAERQAERYLQNLATGGSVLHTINENLPTDRAIMDATEGLLETDAAYFFSPAGRYTIAPHTLYGGLPRSLWTGALTRWGLLADADIVREYGSPSSYSATMTPQGVGGEPEEFHLDDTNNNSSNHSRRSNNNHHENEDTPLMF